MVTASDSEVGWTTTTEEVSEMVMAVDSEPETGVEAPEMSNSTAATLARVLFVGEPHAAVHV
jgi:hypothetical protein